MDTLVVKLPVVIAGSQKKSWNGINCKFSYKSWSKSKNSS